MVCLGVRMARAEARKRRELAAKTRRALGFVGCLLAFSLNLLYGQLCEHWWRRGTPFGGSRGKRRHLSCTSRGRGRFDSRFHHFDLEVERVRAASPYSCFNSWRLTLLPQRGSCKSEVVYRAAICSRHVL